MLKAEGFYQHEPDPYAMQGQMSTRAGWRLVPFLKGHAQAARVRCIVGIEFLWERLCQHRETHEGPAVRHKIQPFRMVTDRGHVFTPSPAVLAPGTSQPPETSWAADQHSGHGLPLSLGRFRQG